MPYRLQTEFGWPVLANMRGLGLFPIRPGSAGKSVPGWDMRVLSPSTATSDGTGAEFFQTRTEEQLHVGGHHEHRAAETASRTPLRHHSRLHPSAFAQEADSNELGPLVIRLPLPPGALPTLFNAEPRFRKSYTDPFPGYFSVCDEALMSYIGNQQSIGVAHADW
jgi:propionyl-CoA synthetase